MECDKDKPNLAARNAIVSNNNLTAAELNTVVQMTNGLADKSGWEARGHVKPMLAS